MHLNRYPHIKIKLKSFIHKNVLSTSYLSPSDFHEKKAYRSNVMGNSNKISDDCYQNDKSGIREYLTKMPKSEGLNSEKRSPLEKWFY